MNTILFLIFNRNRIVLLLSLFTGFYGKKVNFRTVVHDLSQTNWYYLLGDRYLNFGGKTVRPIVQTGVVCSLSRLCNSSRVGSPCKTISVASVCLAPVRYPSYYLWFSPLFWNRKMFDRWSHSRPHQMASLIRCDSSIYIYTIWRVVIMNWFSKTSFIYISFGIAFGGVYSVGVQMWCRSSTMASRKNMPRCKYEEGEKVLCYEPDPAKTRVLYNSKVIFIYSLITCNRV